MSILPGSSDTGGRTPRPVVVLATLGLVATLLVCVVALAYDVIVNSGDASAVVSIASVSVGALAGLASGVSIGRAMSQQDGP